ncbi:MAG: hypothetical protein JXR13_12575 [Thalassovita sp.]
MKFRPRRLEDFRTTAKTGSITAPRQIAASSRSLLRHKSYIWVFLQRPTTRELPTYRPQDELVSSGVGPLVRWLDRDGTPTPSRTDYGQGPRRGKYHVSEYRARTEGAFSKIERWERSATDVHWRVFALDGKTAVYGHSPETRIASGGDVFHSYRTKVDKRLGQIRASENIKGEFRQMALFQPEIDPRRLMNALAMGQSLDAAVQGLSRHRGGFRFKASLSRARATLQNVIHLGGALQSAISRKDAEGLAHLRRVHERNLLEASTTGKKLHLKELQERRAGIETSIKAAEERQSHFNDLASDGLSSWETKAQLISIAALEMQNLVAATRMASVPGYLSPTIFGMADGGQNVGRAIEIGAGAADSEIAFLSQAANLAETQASHNRRAEDWMWQADLAAADLERLNGEMAVLEVEIAQAEADMDLHDLTARLAEEMNTYVEQRFSNSQMINWKAGKLTSLYFQSFSLALEFAKKADPSGPFRQPDPLGLALRPVAGPRWHRPME